MKLLIDTTAKTIIIKESEPILISEIIAEIEKVVGCDWSTYKLIPDNEIHWYPVFPPQPQQPIITPIYPVQPYQPFFTY